MTVSVYRNLIKGCWSVRDKSRKVIGHLDVVHIKNATFSVSEKGRQRVLRVRQKNVHAFVKGELMEVYVKTGYFKTHISNGFLDRFLAEAKADGDFGEELSYDPYVQGYFFRVRDGSKVTSAKYVRFNQLGKVYGYGCS